MKKIMVFFFLIIFMMAGCKQSVENLIEQGKYEEAYKICNNEEVNFKFNTTEVAGRIFFDISCDCINNYQSDASINLNIHPKKGFEKLKFEDYIPPIYIKFKADLAGNGEWKDYVVNSYEIDDDLIKFPKYGNATYYKNIFLSDLAKMSFGSIAGKLYDYYSNYFKKTARFKFVSARFGWEREY